MTATMTEVRSSYQRAAATVDEVIRQVQPSHHHLPTPCRGWTVRDLLGHLIDEARWTVPLLAGLTVAEVGGSLQRIDTDESPV